jgi:hypothetical protein
MKLLALFGFFLIFGAQALRASDSTKICLHPVKNGTKWGYANIEGQCIIPFAFDSAMLFSEGLALIELNNLWGFIDKNGKIAISPQFIYAESFSCGLAKVFSKDPKYPTAFINTRGRLAFRCRYRDVTGFTCGRARVIVHKGIWYINRKGEVVIKTPFPYGGVFYEGIAQVWSEKSAKFIDTNGKRIAFFYEMGHFDFSEGTASVLGNGHPFYINSVGQKIRIAHRSFYIDKMGNPTLTNTVDSLVYFPFSDGMAEVCIPGTGHKSGYIDRAGKLVVPIIYDFAYPFSNGVARVFRDGKGYWIDKNGNVVELRDWRMYLMNCDQRSGE